MAVAACRVHPEPGGRRLLRSVITPFCPIKACWENVGPEEEPTTWPALLMPLAVLPGPPRVPRSVITPFCHRKAWLEEPTTWATALMTLAVLPGPPRVPRSVI